MTRTSLGDRAALRSGLLSRIARRAYQALIGRNNVAASRAPDFLRYTGNDGTILVIGGGTVGEGTGLLWNIPSNRRVSFDVYASPNVDFVADAHSIPLQDGSVDGVWIQAILEHVVDPWKVVSEIDRVLKPNGVVYAETPFMQQVHEGAYDFFRFSHSAHRLLFRSFTEIASGQVMGAGTALLWAIRYFARSVTGSNAVGRVATLPFFWLRFFDDVGPLRYRLDAASGFFFLGRKLAQPMPLKDLPTYYRDSGRAHAGTRD